MKTRKLQNSKFIRQETTQPYTHRIANCTTAVYLGVTIDKVVEHDDTAR